MTLSPRRVLALAAALYCGACADASKKPADTTQAATNSSQALAPTARPRPPLKIATPDTSASIGEIIDAPTIMRENGSAPRPRDKDPLPNVIGETRKSGGRMKPLPPRDSAFGPEVGIDKDGNPTPIKN